MTKDPANYTEVHPGAYDYHAWWNREKGSNAYNLNTHYKVWTIFQAREFWDNYFHSSTEV